LEGWPSFSSKLGHCGGGQQKQDWKRLDQSVKHGDGALQHLGQLRGTAIEETRDHQTARETWRRSGEREELLKE
jgi:hypothetical protein